MPTTAISSPNIASVIPALRAAAVWLAMQYSQPNDDIQCSGALALKTELRSVNDAVDGCAGRPAEGRRCESVTVKA
jgi:hypothetical protein